jgi:Zn-dependent M28 family amino/carboxypeptidase
MNKNFFYTLILATGLVTFTGCQNDQSSESSSKSSEKKEELPPIETPDFSADSAYSYIEKQVAFGPRVPNTEEHAKCAQWLEQKMKSFGADVIVQEAQVKAFDNTRLQAKNIIAQFDKDNPNRILLFAHWDTRPFADKDDERTSEPILGANDGGSGVGVLIEIGRQLQQLPTEYGVDIIFFDAEDYGPPNGSMIDGKAEQWCLGSQHWARNPHKPNYNAQYGILLDMVGGKDAVFPKEGTSMYYAPGLVRDVWRTAGRLGHGNLFTNDRTGATTDDHLFVNEYAKIPSVCIVEFHTSESTYGDFHHTHEDDMDVIGKNTLNAVGETVMEVIYQTRAPR